MSVPLIVLGTVGCLRCLNSRGELRPLFSVGVIRYSGKGPLKTFPDRAGRLHFHPTGRFEQELKCALGHSKKASWTQICWCGWKAAG